jgi:hypothetical protein
MNNITLFKNRKLKKLLDNINKVKLNNIFDLTAYFAEPIDAQCMINGVCNKVFLYTNFTICTPTAIALTKLVKRMGFELIIKKD